MRLALWLEPEPKVGNVDGVLTSFMMPDEVLCFFFLFLHHPALASTHQIIISVETKRLQDYFTLALYIAGGRSTSRKT